MNTDIRRKIFVSIMGADDFVDAHGRLTRLRLTKAQQPEIVRVLLECCGQGASSTATMPYLPAACANLTARFDSA